MVVYCNSSMTSHSHGGNIHSNYDHVRISMENNIIQFISQIMNGT